MRPIWTVLLYVMAVFVVGALLAPWLYWGTQALASHHAFFQTFAHQPFHRFISRSVLGTALAGLWPVARYSRIQGWREAGLWRAPQSWRHLLHGAFLGFASLATIAFLAIAFEVRKWNALISARHMEESIWHALLAAIVVAFLEEIMFRGVLFTALRKGHTRLTALFASSVIYAVVHFFKVVPWHEPVAWYSGLQVLAQMMQGFVDPQMLVPQFFVLLLVGIILALGFEKTGALWFSIGAHAGWIFWLKIYGVLTVENSSRLLSFWGTSRLTDGWFAALVLLGLALILWDRTQPRLRTRTADVHLN